jgi:hypothetical protein
MTGERAETLGRLLHETRNGKGTIDGKPLPDAKKFEESEWYTAFAQQLLEALDGPLCPLCHDGEIHSGDSVCEYCERERGANPYYRENRWYFYEETQMEQGPFVSLAHAQEAFAIYVRNTLESNGRPGDAERSKELHAAGLK